MVNPMDQLQEILAQQQADAQQGGPASLSVQQQPINAVDAENMPMGGIMKHKQICELIGSLVLESHHRFISLEDNAKAITRQLDEQRRVLLQDNEGLNKELESLRTEIKSRDSIIEELRGGDGQGSS